MGYPIVEAILRRMHQEGWYDPDYALAIQALAEQAGLSELEDEVSQRRGTEDYNRLIADLLGQYNLQRQRMTHDYTEAGNRATEDLGIGSTRLYEQQGYAGEELRDDMGSRGMARSGLQAEAGRRLDKQFGNQRSDMILGYHRGAVDRRLAFNRGIEDQDYQYGSQRGDLTRNYHRSIEDIIRGRAGRHAGYNTQIATLLRQRALRDEQRRREDAERQARMQALSR